MRSWMIFAALLIGCKGETDTSETDTNADADTDSDTDADTDSDTDADTDADTDTDTDADTDTDTEPDLGAPSEELTGNVSSGAVVSLDWADDSPMFCWPSTENVNFNGKHVFFTIDKEGMDDIYVKLEPQSGKDLSLYTLEFSGAVQTPPNVTSSSRCEASYDQVHDSNPGAVESIGLLGFPTRTVLVGVAGANGEDDASFTLKVWKGDSGMFDTGL